ncbi:CHAD domain-containing protein [Aestuariivirga sp.]|uniref:CHAD domain-containing protein n=1 Tax=Aestuariivirga sp. TaxID=2650926 RepID=UPI0035932A4E
MTELPDLSRTAPSPSSLKAAARAQLGALMDDLEKAAAEGSSVHGARRRIKRLRSLLRLIRSVIGERAYVKANDTLRAAADSLAGQRRAEALVAAARKLDDRSAGGQRLLKIAEDHRRDHAALSPGDALAGAMQAVASASKSVSGWRIAKGTPASISDAFTRTYRTARKDLAAALDSEEPEALHEARKQVIHHLHHLELLRGGLRKPPDTRLAELEVLREILGDLNDLDELRLLAEANGEHPRKHVAKTIARHRGVLLARVRKTWKPLFKSKPKAFAKRIGAMWDEAQG